jgi:hypothetical protein
VRAALLVPGHSVNLVRSRSRASTPYLTSWSAVARARATPCSRLEHHPAPSLQLGSEQFGRDVVQGPFGR